MTPLVTRTTPLHVRSDGEGPRSVSAVVATERPTLIYDPLSGRVIEEVLLMSGATLPSQTPLLLDHERAITAQVGSAGDFRIDGGELVGTLRFANGHDRAEQAWALVSERHARSVSIGYRVTDYVSIHPGKTKIVNGRSFTARANYPTRVATRWELYEVSLVPIGGMSPSVNFSLLSEGWRLARFGLDFALDEQDLVDG